MFVFFCVAYKKWTFLTLIINQFMVFPNIYIYKIHIANEHIFLLVKKFYETHTHTHARIIAKIFMCFCSYVTRTCGREYISEIFILLIWKHKCFRGRAGDARPNHAYMFTADEDMFFFSSYPSFFSRAPIQVIYIHTYIRSIYCKLINACKSYSGFLFFFFVASSSHKQDSNVFLCMHVFFNVYSKVEIYLEWNTSRTDAEWSIANKLISYTSSEYVNKRASDESIKVLGRTEHYLCIRWYIFVVYYTRASRLFVYIYVYIYFTHLFSAGNWIHEHTRNRILYGKKYTHMNLLF